MSVAHGARRVVRELLAEHVAAVEADEYAAVWSRVVGLPVRSAGVGRSDVLSVLGRDSARGLAFMRVPDYGGTSRPLFDAGSPHTWEDVTLTDTGGQSLAGERASGADANATWELLAGSLDRLRAARAMRDGFSMASGSCWTGAWDVVRDELGPFCCDDAEAFWRWAAGSVVDDPPAGCDGGDLCEAKQEYRWARDEYLRAREAGDRAGMVAAYRVGVAANEWAVELRLAAAVRELGR